MAKHLNVNLAFTADTSQAKAQLQDLQRQLTNLTTVSSINKFDLTKDIREATQAAAQLKVQLESATNATTGKLDLSKFNAQLQKSGMSLSDYQAKLSAMGPVGQQAFASVAKSIMQAEVSIRRSNGLLTEMGTTLMNTARWQLSSSILHGFMGVVQKAWGYAKDLNSSLSDIRIVTGQNVDQMAKFADQANRAAKELNTTTTAYTKASLIYYQQGLDDSQVKARTDVTVKMANVANQSAEVVSDQMTAVWNNFYDGSKSLEYYADVMTALGAATASSTDEISQGLNKFAAVAETVGLSYEYAASALATITSNTRESADVVGNALKTLFARIQGLKLGETLEDGVDLNKYSKALDAVGIKVLDSNGELKAMDTLLTELAGKWDTIGKAEQTALAQTVAGVRQYTQLVALMENWDNGDNDSMMANLETSYGATGALQEQADIYAESWKAARDSVKASAEDIYDSILDDQFFIKITKGFADFLDIISNTADALGGMKGVIALLGGTLLTAFGPKLAGNIDNFVSKLLFGAKAAEEMKLKTASLMTRNTSAESKDNLSNVSLMDNQKLSAASINSAYEAQGKAQVLMIQNASKLSDQERQIASILLDQNESATQLVSKRADALKIAQQEAVRSKLTMEMATKYAGDEGKSIRARMRAFEDQGAKKMRYSAANSILGSISEDEKNIDLLQTKVKDLKKLLQGHIPADLLDISDDEKDITKLQEKIKQLKNITRENETKANELMTKHGEQIKEAGAAAGIDPKIITDYLASQDLVITKNGELVDANNNVVGSLANIEEFMNRAKTKTYSFGQGLVSLASMITSVTMAFNQLKGVKDIWDNEDLSTGEKIVSTLSSMAMIIPMLVNSFNAENIAKLAGLKIDTAKLKTQLLVNLGKKAEGAETASLTALIWQNVAARIAENWQLALIIAAMALLTVAIIAAAKAYNKEAEEAKKAKEAAEGLAKAAEETKSKANDLRSAFDGYTSVIDKLNECTKGTQEWKDALSDVYTEVTAILAKFPELAKIDGFIKSDGTIDIDKFEQIVDQADRAAKVADYASIMGNNVYNQEQYEADAVDARRTIDDTYAYASTKDLIVPQSGGDEPISTSMQGQEKFITNIDKILMDNIDALVDDSDGTLFRDELKKLFPDPGDMPDYEGFIDSLMQYQTTLNELAAQATNNATALENSANLIARQELGEDRDDAVVEIASEAYEKAYNAAYNDAIKQGKEGINAWSSKNDAEVIKFWEQYSTATGTNYKLDKNAVIGDDNKRYFQYLEGGDIKKVSLEEAAAAIAAAEALKSLDVSARDAAVALNEIKGDYASGIKNFIATGNFDSVSQSQVEEMRAQAFDEDGNVQEDNVFALFGGKGNFEKIANMMAPEDLGEFENATDWFLNEFTTELNNIDFSEIGKGFTQSAQDAFNNTKNKNGSQISQLSANQQNSIVSLFDEAFAKAGQEGLNVLEEVFSKADLDADELLKVQEILANTDWKTTSFESLTNALEEGGVAASGMEGPLSKVIDLMKEAAGITLDDSVEQFKLYKDILEKVENGEGIEDEVYQNLPEELKAFFNFTAEGLWAMTGDAEAFYNLVKEKQFENFKQTKANAQAENDKINETIATEKYKDVGSEAITQMVLPDETVNVVDYDKAQLQYDYLELLGKQDEGIVKEYKDAINSGTLTNELVSGIADLIAQLGDQTAALEQRQSENNSVISQADSAIASEATSVSELNIKASMGEISPEAADIWREDVREKEIESLDLDNEEIEERTEKLQELAKTSEDIAETLSNDSDAAKEAAKEMARFDRAIEDLTDNYKKWKKALDGDDISKKTKAMEELKDVYGDMLDLDPESFSEGFLESAKNLELMNKAAEGSQEAYDQLQALAAVDILEQNNFGEVSEEVATELAEIAAIEGVDVGEKVYIGSPVGDKLWNMYNEAYMAAIEGGHSVAEAMGIANDVINAVGYNPPEIEMEEKTVTVTGQMPKGWKPQVNGSVIGPDGQVMQGVRWTQEDSGTYTYTQTIMVPKKSDKPFTKSAERLGGGTKPSGGGGGSKQKDTKKASDEIERYHEIKEVIEDLTRQYESINKARTRAFGMETIELMDQEIAKTNELIDAQHKYLSEIELNHGKDKDALTAYGAIFDSQGRIINYDEIMTQQLEKFNASRTEAAEEAYKEFKEILEQYEETQNLLEEQKEELKELENQLYDQKLEKVNIEVDLKVSVQDDQLSILEYMLEKLEDDAYGVAEAFALIGRQAEIFQNKSRIAQEGIDKILANHDGITLEEALAGGTQLGLTADEIESLRTYRDTLLESNQALLEMREIAIEQVTDTFDKWNEKFEKQIELLEHYSSIMESFANIIDIVGKDILGISDDMMKNLTQASVDNAINTLEGQKKRVDALRKSEEELRSKLAETTNEEERAILQEALDHIISETNAAEEDMLSTWEETLEAAADAFEEAVDLSISSFEKAISGTYGSLEGLQTAFDQASEIADRYVDDYKEIYELSKLNRDITNSIDNTDNVKAKKALRDLQKEIVELQESDVQMSEYDLEHLRAKYELRLAEIALEEAQNAKSQVRMRKDSEGNYSYVFTADASAVEKAQQNYENKLYEMQELNSEYIKEMQNNILQSEIELANALRELDKVKFKSDEEYYAEVNRLTQYYTGQRDYYLDELNKSLKNNKQTVDEDWKAYSDATGYKMSADKDYMDSFDETIYAQLTGYRSIEDAQNKFADATKVMVEDLKFAFKKWQENTEAAMKAAGTSIQDFGKDVKDAVYGEGENDKGIVGASEDVVTAIEDIADEMGEAFGEEAMDKFAEFAANYVDNLLPMIEATDNLINKINELILKEAELDKDSNPLEKPKEPEEVEPQSPEPVVNPSAGPSTTNPYGKPSELSGNYQNYTERSGVKAIQHALKEMGYDIGSYGIDGKYGSTTAAAVKAFQKASGITADGIVGPDTKSKFKVKGYLTGGRVDSTGWAWLDGTRERPEYVLNADQTDAFIRLVDDLHYLNELNKLADVQKKGMLMIENTAKELMNSLEFVDDVMRVIELNAGMQSIGLGHISTNTMAMGTEPALQQEITIHAEFPDATDHNEIEAAFDSLFIRASQFANRKN